METSHGTVDPAEFRPIIGRFATGVTVMTSLDGDEPHGMTANAVSSVSLDPVLVLVCVEEDTEMARVVPAAGAFGLSILRADQMDVSNHFADSSRPLGGAQFDGIATRTAKTGVPLLADCLAWLDCRVWAIHDGGDHDIVVGEVVDLGVVREGPALGYYRSTYLTIERPEWT